MNAKHKKIKYTIIMESEKVTAPMMLLRVSQVIACCLTFKYLMLVFN